MGLKCGIIGLPNAGKSTLFNALTSSFDAQTGNYAFCTIDANKGQVFVPDDRLKQIGSIVHSKQVVPTSIEFIDIAGLVKGASQGEGLGNQFLSHIRSTDSLLHLVRVFEDSKITHVYGKPDYIRDIEIINTELVLSDLEIAERKLEKIRKIIASSNTDKQLHDMVSILKKALKTLQEGNSLRNLYWSKDEIIHLSHFDFISLKPMLYVCNLKEEGFLEQQEQVKQKLKLGEKEDLLFVSCVLETEMTGWKNEEKKEFLKSLGLKQPALHAVIKKVYEQLNLISFFTAGEKETKAWTVLRQSFAPKAAGVIHSDFEKGFIRAEVCSYKDLLQYKSKKILKQQGLIKTVGKDYRVQDGDILHFLFKV